MWKPEKVMHGWNRGDRGPPSGFLPKQAEFSMSASATWQSQASPPGKAEPEPTTQSLRTVDWIGTHKRPCQLSREPRSAYITVLDIELVSWLTGICWKDSPDSSFKSLPTVGLGIRDYQGQRMRALK